MLANIPRSVLPILLPFALLIAVSAVVGGMAWALVAARKRNVPQVKWILLASVLSVVIATASWLFNFGWIRFFLTFLCVPFVHAAVFFLTNILVAMYAEWSKKIGAIQICFGITYLLSYLLLPDAGDYGESYFFFGLVRSDAWSSVAGSIAFAAVLTHIVLFVLLVVFAVISKRKVKSTPPT